MHLTGPKPTLPVKLGLTRSCSTAKVADGSTTCMSCGGQAIEMLASHLAHTGWGSLENAAVTLVVSLAVFEFPRAMWSSACDSEDVDKVVPLSA